MTNVAEWTKQVKQTLRNVENNRRRLVGYAIVLGRLYSERPEGVTLQTMSEAFGLAEWTKSMISMGHAIHNDYVVEGGANPKDLEKWGLRNLYEWRPSWTGLTASEVLKDGPKGEPPKVEELPSDSPKAVKAAKKGGTKGAKKETEAAPKVEATPKESESPKEDAPKESEACRSDEVRVKLSRGTLSRLTQLKCDAFPTLDDVVQMLLDRQTPSGNGQAALKPSGKQSARSRMAS